MSGAAAATAVNASTPEKPVVATEATSRIEEKLTQEAAGPDRESLVGPIVLPSDQPTDLGTTNVRGRVPHKGHRDDVIDSPATPAERVWEIMNDLPELKSLGDSEGKTQASAKDKNQPTDPGLMR